MLGHLARSIVLAVVCLGLLLPPASTGTAVAATEGDRWCFPQVAHCIGGRFLAYWRDHGGLALNGYPLSDELRETLDDGQEYTVQYFERVRLEYHPENAAPNDILLGQFGRAIRTADPPVAPLPAATYFAETGHNLARPAFLEYWQDNGGLAQFGYPISEELTEALEDGNQYNVQYFERARFEWHPDNPAATQVLLGQFGRSIFSARSAISGSIVYLGSDRRTVRRIAPDGTPLPAPFNLTLDRYDTVTYFSVNRTLDTAVYSYVEATSRTKTAILQSGQPVQIYDGLLSPRWSPDGRYLLAQRRVNPATLEFEDLVYDTTTRTLTSLGKAHFPGWDLDSKHLLYGEAGNIYRMPVTGGVPTQITALPSDDAGRWGLSGDAYALGNNVFAFFGSPIRDDSRSYRWWSIAAGGTTPTALSEPEERYGENTRYPYNEMPHPLGTWLAYTATTAGGVCITPTQAFQNRPKVIRATAAGPRAYHLDREDGFALAPEEGMQFDQYGWSPTSDWLVLGMLTFRCDQQTTGRPTVREPAIYLWTADPAPGEPHVRSLDSGWFPTWVP